MGQRYFALASKSLSKSFAVELRDTATCPIGEWFFSETVIIEASSAEDAREKVDRMFKKPYARIANVLEQYRTCSEYPNTTVEFEERYENETSYANLPDSLLNAIRRTDRETITAMETRIAELEQLLVDAGVTLP